MSDNSDPGYIAARELDATLQKLRCDVCAKDAALKACKEGKEAASPLNWVLAVVFAFLLFCLFQMCGRRP